MARPPIGPRVRNHAVHAAAAHGVGRQAKNLRRLARRDEGTVRLTHFHPAALARRVGLAARGGDRRENVLAQIELGQPDGAQLIEANEGLDVTRAEEDVEFIGRIEARRLNAPQRRGGTKVSGPRRAGRRRRVLAMAPRVVRLVDSQVALVVAVVFNHGPVIPIPAWLASLPARPTRKIVCAQVARQGQTAVRGLLLSPQKSKVFTLRARDGRARPFPLEHTKPGAPRSAAPPPQRRTVRLPQRPSQITPGRLRSASPSATVRALG